MTQQLVGKIKSKMFQGSDPETEEKYEFKWEEHYNFLKKQLTELVTLKEFSDVSIVCDDQIEIQAHKNILSGSSPVFKNILHMNSCREKPVIYLRGIKSREMKSILNFIYLGQVIIPQSSMKDFLAVANDLEIEHLNNVMRKTQFVERNDMNKKVSLQSRVTKGKGETVQNTKYPEYNELDPLASGDVKLEYLDSSTVAISERQSSALAIPDNSNTQDQSIGLDKNLMNSKDMQEKIRKCKKYVCDKCDFRAARREQLQLHKDTKHDNVQVSWGVGLVWNNLNKNGNK